MTSLMYTALVSPTELVLQGLRHSLCYWTNGMDAAERGTEAAGPPKVLAEPATAAEAPPQPEFIPLPDEEEEDDDDDDDDDESSSSEHDSAHEFGPAGADDSSSWEDSEEEQETHEPIDRDKLPAWLSRRRKQGRCEAQTLAVTTHN